MADRPIYACRPMAALMTKLKILFCRTLSGREREALPDVCTRAVLCACTAWRGPRLQGASCRAQVGCMDVVSAGSQGPKPSSDRQSWSAVHRQGCERAQGPGHGCRIPVPPGLPTACHQRHPTSPTPRPHDGKLLPPTIMVRSDMHCQESASCYAWQRFSCSMVQPLASPSGSWPTPGPPTPGGCSRSCNHNS